jgi:gas vesicle protein
MNSGKVILGALAGVATGALIGILFAPDKGSEFRKKIVHQGEDYFDSVKEKFNGFVDGIYAKFNEKEDSDIGHKRKTNSKNVSKDLQTAAG